MCEHAQARLVMFKLGLSLLPIRGFLQDGSSFCSHQTLSKLAFCFAFDVNVQVPIRSVEDFAVLQRAVSLDSQLLTFSEPLNDIRFTIQQQDGDLVWIRGFGTETDFEFKLEGEINPDEGRIPMIKEFPGIERVRLEGWVSSPFGIIGT
ncbi:hypothetical protein PG987_016463 [Apiospora arundinis]